MKATPFTATELLQPGYWFLYQNRLYEICIWDSKRPLQVIAQAANSDEQTAFTLTELFAADPPTHFAATVAELTMPAEMQETMAMPVLDVASMPESLQERAKHIIQIVEAVENGVARIHQLEKDVSRTVALERMCHALPIPIALCTYYKYRRMYKKYQADQAQIAMALHRKTYGKTRMDPNVLHFVDTIIQRFYRSNPPLRKETVYQILQQMWHHNHHWWLDVVNSDTEDCDDLIELLLDALSGIDQALADTSYRSRLTQVQLPSRSWFYNYVHWFDSQPEVGAETYRIRHGQAAWEANFRLFDRFCRHGHIAPPVRFCRPL